MTKHTLSLLFLSLLPLSGSAMDLASQAMSAGAAAAEACQPCANVNAQQLAKQRADAKFPPSDPANQSSNQEFFGRAMQVYNDWNIYCKNVVENASQAGSGVKAAQDSAAAFAKENVAVPDDAGQEELAGICQRGNSVSRDLTAATDETNAASTLSVFSQQKAGLQPNADFSGADDLPGRQRCEQAVGSFVTSIENVRKGNSVAAASLNNLSGRCGDIAQNMGEDEGFTVDDALKYGQLAQMAMGATQALNQGGGAGGDGDFNPLDAGFGQDPFDFDPTKVPGFDGGAGGTGTGPTIADLSKPGTDITPNGVQAAFIPDANSNGVEVASLTPAAVAALPTSESFVGSDFGGSGENADAGVTGAAVSAVGGSGGGLGGSSSGSGSGSTAGASRAPASDNESNAARSGGGGGGGFGGSGGSMLGLSSDVSGLDDFGIDFKNPFAQKKEEAAGDEALEFAGLSPNNLPTANATQSLAKGTLDKESLFYRVHSTIALNRERGGVR